MAYDDNGNYYFDPNLDSEDAEALQNVDRQAAAMQWKQNQQITNFMQSKVNEGTQQALKELGITPEEFAAFSASDPVKAGEIAKQSAYKHVSKVVSKARQRGTDGRFVKQGTQPAMRETRSRPSTTIQAAKERTSRGEQLHDDELIDLLDSMLAG